jgi:hypothetical protein
VEFYLDGVPRDEKKQVVLPANGEMEVKFLTPKLDPGVPLHQGFVRLVGAPDPLEFDDVRYFTLKVQPALRVLVVSNLSDDGRYIADALDPPLLPEGTARAFRVDRIRTEAFAAQNRDALKDYHAVFLNNVQELNESEWGRLNAYVHDGGGLVIGLGHLCNSENYNIGNASQLLPATPKESAVKVDTTFGKVTDLTHPLFRRYTREIDAQLAQVPVFRYWPVAVPQGSRVLLAFADGKPALVERTFKNAKTGRVLLWTTSLARRPDPKSPAAFNEFPLPEAGGWSFYVVMNQTVPYLAGTSNERLNYEAGEDVILPIDPTKRFKNFTVRNGDGKTTDRLTPPATSDALVIVAPQPVGPWTVTASGGDGGKETQGFSVNVPIRETQLAALEKADLDVLFGKDGYQVAESPEDLIRLVKIVRVGQEMFPWLMALILILVTLENLLANRFHRESTPRPAVGAVA